MSSHNRSKVLSNFAALSIVQGANFLIPILVIPYVITKVGADGFGEISVAQVIIMFFTTIADYGFNLTATRDVSINRNNPTKLSQVFFTVFLVRLVLCAGLFLAMLLGVFCLPFLRAHSSLYLLAFVSVLGQSILTTWLFQGIEKMKVIIYISLLARIIFVFCVLCFIKKKDDNIYFIFFSGIGNLFAGLISLLFAYKFLKLSFIIPTINQVKEELSKGWHITISNLSVSIYMYINILLLRVFTNSTIVGYYSIAEKIISIGRQVLSVYFQAIYPQVCQLAATSKKEVSLFFEKYHRPFLVSIFAGCVVLFLFPEFFVHLFIKDPEASASDYLQILSFVPFIVCLNIPAYQLLIANNEKRTLLIIFTIGTFLNIVSSFILVPRMGAVATSYIVLITELFITIVLIFSCYRNEKTKVDYCYKLK
jgi:polysaccharide transporter, PST family